MQIQIFNIPITDTGEQLAEMNRFLSGHKVLEVEQKFFQNEKGGYWSFCVRFLPDVAVAATNNTGRSKRDYKQELTQEQFAVFSRLREIRKSFANEDGVPAYAVFTDEELCHFARLPELTEKTMAGVPGIGEKKMARYGKTMLEQYGVGKEQPGDTKDENRI